jgi:phosphoenolpyruvate phosphomutase
MRKTTALKNMIQSSQLEFIMEAHNGLTAKIVEEAGFKGIWGSGLSISAALGVRDNNEASWTQVIEVLEFMSDATKIPILLDGDTGYGNFNNARRLVKKLEQRDIAGVCIEDKLFPKTNSFVRGEAQPLADMDEFCGKIKAMKDTQTDSDFIVVARVEAFICGWGLGEALRRAEAYREAGADAVLIHSRKAKPSEIQAFMKEWGCRHPVVIVPTTYYSTPTDSFREMGISMAIWANHCLRASVAATQKITAQILKDESLINVEDTIVPVSEVFRLQGDAELEAAEKRYLPFTGEVVNAIILAASPAAELGDLTQEMPRAMVEVKGKPILSSILEVFDHLGISDRTVVRGYAKDKITGVGFRTVDNPEYDETTELYSLYLARNEIRENTVISYGDIVFRSYILNDLLNDTNDITLMVDADAGRVGSYHDYVKASPRYSRHVFLNPVRLQEMGRQFTATDFAGEFIGLFKTSGNGAPIVRDYLNRLSQRPDFRKLRMKDLFNEIAKDHPIAVKYVRGGWLDINAIVDLQTRGTSSA